MEEKLDDYKGVYAVDKKGCCGADSIHYIWNRWIFALHEAIRDYLGPQWLDSHKVISVVIAETIIGVMMLFLMN